MKSLLFADDLQNHLTQLSQAARELGYASVLVRAGEDVVQNFRQHPSELLVISLLREDALHVCEGVREEGEGAIAPIIFVGTGREMIRSPSDALSQGGDYYFTLPLDFAQVMAKIRTYVGQGSAEPQSSVHELDYFQILGVSRTCTAPDIEQAYARLCSTSVDTELKQILADAREVLLDEDLRQAYARHVII